MEQIARVVRTRPANPNQRLLSLRQTSELFGVPERTLHDLVARGDLPGVVLPGGRKIWLRREDIERLIANSITGSEAYEGPPR